jgi:kynurenine formamidase
MIRTAIDPRRPIPALALLAALAAAGLAVGGSSKDAPKGEPVADVRPTLDMSAVRVVDLTHPFDEKTIYWPTSPSTFELKNLHYGLSGGGFFYSANSFCAPEHGGTHLDAPSHFAKGKWAADEVPIDRLVGPAMVIDVSGKADDDADYRLTLEDVERWEKSHGTIPKGAIVLLRTGWDARWPSHAAYLGDDTPGDASNLHFPSFGAEAARFLVETRKVHAIGVDTASIDHGPSKDFPVHRLTAEANVPALENLKGLDALPEVGAWLVAAPMKIAGGSGGPARVIALVP